MVRPLTSRNLLTLVLILVAGTLSVLALRSWRKWEPEATFESIPENVDLTLRKIKYTKTRDGEPLWTLVADSADHSMEDGITRIINVRMIFFDHKIGDITLTADQGEILSENLCARRRRPSRRRWAAARSASPRPRSPRGRRRPGVAVDRPPLPRTRLLA